MGCLLKPKGNYDDIDNNSSRAQIRTYLSNINEIDASYKSYSQIEKVKSEYIEESEIVKTQRNNWGYNYGPPTGLKISTNFGGERTYAMQDNNYGRQQQGYQQQHSYGREMRRQDQDNDDNFLSKMVHRFGISAQQLSGIFDKVSKSREDVVDFLESNGQRQELLWTADEDEMLRKHYQTPAHSLMKLLTKLKSRERIEKRKQYLFLK